MPPLSTTFYKKGLFLLTVESPKLSNCFEIKEISIADFNFIVTSVMKALHEQRKKFSFFCIVVVESGGLW